MSFRSPSGGVNLNSAYLKLSQLITKSEAQRAAYNVGEVFLATCLKLELVGEGFSTQHDALLDWMLHARLPYRQGAPVPLQVFKDLLNKVAVLADTEALRASLRTPGVSALPQPRRTQAIATTTDASDLGGVGDSGDDALPNYDDMRVQAASVRYPKAPNCTNCGTPGILGTLWCKLCQDFSELVKICNQWHAVTPARLHARSGWKSRTALPPCGDDDEVTIVIGPTHEIPTAAEKKNLDRQYDRLKAIRERMAAAWTSRDTTVKGAPQARSVQSVRSDTFLPDSAASAHFEPEPPAISDRSVLQVNAPAAVSSTTPALPRRANRKEKKGKRVAFPAPAGAVTPGTGGPTQTVDTGLPHADGGIPIAASVLAPPSAGTAPGSERLRKNDKPTSTASVSPGLSTLFYVLDTPQLPLLSLTGLERAAQAVGGSVDLGTCSDTNTASITLRAQTGVFPLRARRERGYPVVRGDLAPDGMFILSPHGAHVLIVDTGAQASVLGP
jgi:hypothetical protein